MPKRRANRKHRSLYLAVSVAVLLAALVGAFVVLSRPASPPKPIILYVNQGNGAVDETNFHSLLSFAKSNGFNTIFFQVYREGGLLFNQSALSYFVSQSHSTGEEIFFSLYITGPTQAIPTSIYGLGEDGISLDMSALTTASQELFLGNLQGGYTQGQTAVTTTNMTSTLHPDLLVLETYGPELQQYVRPGVIGSVGVFTTTSQQEYQDEFQYSLAHSDGVMVFDYAGLMKAPTEYW